jgi:hypothetical protein
MQTNTDTVPRYPPAAHPPCAPARDGLRATRSEAAAGVAATVRLRGERVGERPSAKKRRSHMAVILQTTRRRESGDSLA